MLTTSVVESISLKLDLLVIWNFKAANYRRLTLQKSFSSNSQGTRVNAMTKYVGLQQVWAVIWKYTGSLSREKTVNSFVMHAIGLVRIFSPWGGIHAPTVTLIESRWIYAAKVLSQYIYIYIYIYREREREREIDNNVALTSLISPLMVLMMVQ